MKTIYDPKDISKNGKHDFEEPQVYPSCYNMSSGIFQWELKTNKKELKRKKVVVRVIGTKYQSKEIISRAIEVVNLLYKGDWNGPKTVRV